MITYASFVGAFPEFSDSFTYPQGQVEFWANQAYVQLNACRFGAQIDYAAMLFVAHNLVLSIREQKAAEAGQVPGTVQGPVTSKSIDKLSISYSSDTSLDGAGAWNFTTYGQRLFKLIKAYGAGPFYVPGPRRSFVL